MAIDWITILRRHFRKMITIEIFAAIASIENDFLFHFAQPFVILAISNWQQSHTHSLAQTNNGLFRCAVECRESSCTSSICLLLLHSRRAFDAIRPFLVSVETFSDCIVFRRKSYISQTERRMLAMEASHLKCGHDEISLSEQTTEQHTSSSVVCTSYNKQTDASRRWSKRTLCWQRWRINWIINLDDYFSRALQLNGSVKHKRRDDE